jgi:ankyrin repeat protein
VKILLQRGANVEARDPVGETGLLLASSAGHIEIVRLLLDGGAGIDQKSGYTGCTALAYAAVKGRVEVMKLLLERGADPKMKDYHKQTALDNARELKQPEAVKVLKATRTGLFKSW